MDAHSGCAAAYIRRYWLMQRKASATTHCFITGIVVPSQSAVLCFLRNAMRPSESVFVLHSAGWAGVTLTCDNAIRTEGPRNRYADDSRSSCPALCRGCCNCYRGGSRCEAFLIAPQLDPVRPIFFWERAQGHFPLAAPSAPGQTNAAVRDHFQPGDHVRVRADYVPGHIRMPGYIRGKTGVVVSESPAYPFPDAHAHALEAENEPTYGRAGPQRKGNPRPRVSDRIPSLTALRLDFPIADGRHEQQRVESGPRSVAGILRKAVGLSPALCCRRRATGACGVTQ